MEDPLTSFGCVRFISFNILFTNLLKGVRVPLNQTTAVVTFCSADMTSLFNALRQNLPIILQCSCL